MKKSNPCEICIYYHAENNTCQSKKCSTGGSGYVTIFDRLFCKPKEQAIQKKRRKPTKERDG